MVCSSHIVSNEESFAGVSVNVDVTAQSTGKVCPTGSALSASRNLRNTADLWLCFIIFQIPIVISIDKSSHLWPLKSVEC